MALYQNTTVDSDRLIIGNYKIETSATAGGTFVNVGAGMLNSFAHNFTKYDVQAGNAPDPIEGIADESVTFDFDMIEYDASVISAISNGLVSATVTTSQSTLEAGGNTTLTERAYKLTNRRLINSTTVETVITIFKGSIDTGPVINPKSDNDSDPINSIAFSITAINDSSRTAGSQLYTIVKDEV